MNNNLTNRENNIKNTNNVLTDPSTDINIIAQSQPTSAQQQQFNQLTELTTTETFDSETPAIQNEHIELSLENSNIPPTTQHPANQQQEQQEPPEQHPTNLQQEQQQPLEQQQHIQLPKPQRIQHIQIDQQHTTLQFNKPQKIVKTTTFTQETESQTITINTETGTENKSQSNWKLR